MQHTVTHCNTTNEKAQWKNSALTHRPQPATTSVVLQNTCSPPISWWTIDLIVSCRHATMTQECSTGCNSQWMFGKVCFYGTLWALAKKKRKAAKGPQLIGVIVLVTMFGTHHSLLGVGCFGVVLGQKYLFQQRTPYLEIQTQGWSGECGCGRQEGAVPNLCKDLGRAHVNVCATQSNKAMAQRLLMVHKAVQSMNVTLVQGHFLAVL